MSSAIYEEKPLILKDFFACYDRRRHFTTSTNCPATAGGPPSSKTKQNNERQTQARRMGRVGGVNKEAKELNETVVSEREWEGKNKGEVKYGTQVQGQMSTTS